MGPVTQWADQRNPSLNESSLSATATKGLRSAVGPGIEDDLGAGISPPEHEKTH